MLPRSFISGFSCTDLSFSLRVALTRTRLPANNDGFCFVDVSACGGNDVELEAKEEVLHM